MEKQEESNEDSSGPEISNHADRRVAVELEVGIECIVLLVLVL